MIDIRDPHCSMCCRFDRRSRCALAMTKLESMNAIGFALRFNAGFHLIEAEFPGDGNRGRFVVWAREFGRTPFNEKGKGRGHNPLGFSMWLADGGVKVGTVCGATQSCGQSGGATLQSGRFP